LELLDGAAVRADDDLGDLRRDLHLVFVLVGAGLPVSPARRGRVRRRGPWAAGDSPRRVLVRGRRRTAAARDRRSRRRSRRRLGRRKTGAALRTWSPWAGIWAARGDHRTRGRDRRRRIRGLRRICRAGGCRGARVWIGRRIRRFRWAVPCDRIRNRRDRDRRTESGRSLLPPLPGGGGPLGSGGGG
jgi:hypothetical protein